jgi:alpha-D-ribose 1-methylphosphonate 5-triphosphate synthase subunit PhnH
MPPDRHPTFQARVDAQAARVPQLAAGQTWEWNEPDHHHVTVLELLPASDEHPWPYVRCRFPSGIEVVVGATAFARAERVR